MNVNVRNQNGHSIVPYLFEIDSPSVHHFVRVLDLIGHSNFDV
jgi:hypothetical protein